VFFSWLWLRVIFDTSVFLLVFWSSFGFVLLGVLLGFCFRDFLLCGGEKPVLTGALVLGHPELRPGEVPFMMPDRIDCEEF